VQRTQEVIELLFAQGSAVSRLDGSSHDLFPIGITRLEGEAVRESVRREGATCTVEIGLGYGVAALFVCDGLLANGDPAARHVVLDPYQEKWFANCGLQFLDDAGLSDLVEFHAQESQLVLPRFLAEGRTFDAAFVDGDHHFDGVFLDLVYLDRLVRPGGIVFVDDYQLPAVARAVAYSTTNLGWTDERVSTDDELHHWMALRTPSAPPCREYDHYVDF
jgi:predicted O-methyltransferase YrrM